MKEKTIDIKKDFGPYAGGATRESGPFSAEALRDDLLIPALKEYDRVILKIGGINIYTGAFWEECFADLPKRTCMDTKTLRQKLKIDYGGNPRHESREESIWELIENRGFWKVLREADEYEVAQRQAVTA